MHKGWKFWKWDWLDWLFALFFAWIFLNGIACLIRVIIGIIKLINWINT